MTIPVEVQTVIATLQKAGFEAYAVGGCVRDLLLGRTPHDWDVTTNATPDEIQKALPKSFYKNKFGTVSVLNDTLDESLKEIEVTTYRTEGQYSDQRHPDKVDFTTSLTEDLSRRDFTINALAANTETAPQPNSVIIDGLAIIDHFGGIKDLHDQKIRAVGNPKERFEEDALRLLRAVRLATQLDFEIEQETWNSLCAMSGNIKVVSQERIRDELNKIIGSDHPESGLAMLQQSGLLQEIMPELAEGVGIEQNLHHKYDVFTHLIKSLQFAAQYEYVPQVRWAALLHDVGKPRTRRRKGSEYTFYGHDVVSAKMTENILKRLRFSNDFIKQVTHLVRHHMFYYDIGKVTEAGARRLLRRVGQENFDDLIKLRIAERKGSGVPKAEPYRLRHLQFLVEKAASEPVTVNQLAINGKDLMTDLGLKPSPQIGGILNALLAQVLNDPLKNTREYLIKEAEKLKDKDPEELKRLGEAAKEEEEKRRENEIRGKYHV